LHGVEGVFATREKKCKISPNVTLGSLEMFICGELSPKFQIYIEKKANGTLTREKQKYHN